MVHYAHDDPRIGFNLALERVLLRRAPAPSFRLWRGTPCIVVGRHQDAAAEVDLAEAARRGVPVLRRATGGGTVYHDRGVVCFSFVLPASFPAATALRRLVALLGAPGTETERNDVLAGGRKFLGTAQLLADDRRLFHGCALYDADLATLARLLTPPAAKLRRHGVPSVRARVANLRPLLFRQPAPPAGAFFEDLRLRASLGFAGPVRPIPDAWLAEAESLAQTPPFQPLTSNLPTLQLSNLPTL